MLDTDVVIAALDRSDAHHRDAAAAFACFEAERVELLMCSINYAEVLVRPAQDERSLRAATEAINALGVRIEAPDAVVARVAAKHRNLGISLADGFALATAERTRSDLASFDKRVRRALGLAGIPLSQQLT